MTIDRGNLRRAGTAACIVALSVTVLALAPGWPAAATTGAACTFKLVSHPEVGGTPFDQLYGMDALSGSNIWAVGSSGAGGRPLAEHWNGNKWVIVPSVRKGSGSELYDVTAIGPSNVWAVGYYIPTGGGHLRTLVEHWNGNKWVIVPSPNPLSGSDNVLKGVDALSGSNIWAVGGNSYLTGNGNRQLIEHWNGNKWVAMKGAPLAHGGELNDVSAISRTHVVAVGHAGVAGSTEALVERFDGNAWTREPVPGTIGSGAHLWGVSAPAGDAQWAVGARSGTAALQTLTLRNTGSGWTVVSSPNVGTDRINFLNDVSARSAGNAWAVGERESSSFVRRTLVEHFENGHWSVVPSPNAGSGHNRLFGAATPGATNVWAVGTASHPIGSTGLIIHGC